MRALVLVLLVLSSISASAGEKLSGSNVDVRTMLGFKASDTAVQRLLPEGWEISAPAAGPLKGANLLVILIDSVSARDAEGKAVTPIRGAVIGVPAKKKGAEAPATMVVDGITGRDSAPGPYGVYRVGRGLVERKVTFGDGSKPTAEENWVFNAEDGNTIDVRLHYERGPAAQTKAEAKVYSGAKPEFFRIYKWEQVADLVRSSALGVDRVTKMSFKASGSRFGALFDGSEQLIGLISLPVYSRNVFLPD